MGPAGRTFFISLLEKLAVGNLSLSRPEKNAMKLLINRLAEEGAPVDSMG
jgi:hypothetical protein